MSEYENIPAGMQALQILIKKIRNGEYTSGQPLKETVIAKEENLNRNAVREALNQLVGFGIVEYRAFRGYRMKEFTLQDKLEWYELREAIEPIAARRIAKKHDPKIIDTLELLLTEQEQAMKKGDTDIFNYSDLMFHVTLVKHCGNQTFIRQHNDLYLSVLFMATSFEKNSIPDSMRYNRYNKEENDEQTIRVHREILRFIKEGNANEAEVLCRMHARCLVDTMEKVIAAQSKQPDSIVEKIISFEEKINNSQILSALKSEL